MRTPSRGIDFARPRSLYRRLHPALSSSARTAFRISRFPRQLPHSRAKCIALDHILEKMTFFDSKNFQDAIPKGFFRLETPPRRRKLRFHGHYPTKDMSLISIDISPSGSGCFPGLHPLRDTSLFHSHYHSSHGLPPCYASHSMAFTRPRSLSRPLHPLSLSARDAFRSSPYPPLLPRSGAKCSALDHNVEKIRISVSKNFQDAIPKGSFTLETTPRLRKLRFHGH
jgi:hypothetical protein